MTTSNALRELDLDRMPVNLSDGPCPMVHHSTANPSFVYINGKPYIGGAACYIARPLLSVMGRFRSTVKPGITDPDCETLLRRHTINVELHVGGACTLEELHAHVER